MAQSPAHKFGQMIGELLEETIKPVLQEFCDQNHLYLDTKGKRAGVRKGSKVTWTDRYGNHHDLDFVIEKDGNNNCKGRPVAFIEAAWRRYTKHSKNKAQEIQAAVLPIAQEYPWDRPFVGAILAGFFTQNAIEQLQSFGFSVLYFPYEIIILALQKSGIDIRFNESTSDEEFGRCIQKIQSIDKNEHHRLKENLLKINQENIGCFIKDLKHAIDRSIEKLIITPLHGEEFIFSTCTEALHFINNFDQLSRNGEFKKYEVTVRLSNGDSLDASFQSKEGVQKFLKYLSE